MKIILILTSVLLTVNCLSVQEQWISFKEKHGKNYENIIEEKRRFEIFQNNLIIINDHNEKYQKGESSYYMGINKFTDLTAEEFSPKVLNAIPRNKPESQELLVQAPKDMVVPDTFDWRDNGVEFPIRDQGKCFAGYAFSSALALDAQLLIKYNVTTSASVQEIVDCSYNLGCLGGNSMSVYNYVAEHGIRADSDYPYVGKNQSCNNVTTSQKSVLQGQGGQRLASSEDALKWAISNHGPITVYIYGPFLQHYQGGIYDDDTCSNLEDGRTQGILAIGYGSSAGIDYWTLQNSFGADWGEKGYLRLKRNPSICSVLEHISIAYARPV